jgi:catechol 2,3-dioxygenase-like lactoylglutathione lyase family enzyme
MTTFDHVHLFCTDLEAMIGFWTKGLGAEFVKYRKFGPADGAVVSLAGTPIFIKVIPADSPMPNGAARGLNHLGIRVEDPDAFADKLAQEFGCRMVNRPSDDFCFVAHPDGLVFEVMRAGAEI